MAEQRFRKYFIFDDKKNLKLPAYRDDIKSKFIKRITLVDKDNIPNAKFYNETMWILPGFGTESIPNGKKGNFWEEHTHTFGELIGFYGFNYDDVMDLGAEIEFWIDGQKQVIKESFTSYIPAGIKHGPLTIRDVKRPLVHYIACETGEYK
jgi:hypothetical protein